MRIDFTAAVELALQKAIAWAHAGGGDPKAMAAVRAAHADFFMARESSSVLTVGLDGRGREEV